jgi:hypothetical protein
MVEAFEKIAKGAAVVAHKLVFVKRQGWGESCSIRLWEREAYILNGTRTSPKGEVRESKHAVEPRANSTGPCGRPHGRQCCRKSALLSLKQQMKPPRDVNHTKESGCRRRVFLLLRIECA